MNRSDTIAELAKALALAQSEMKGAAKDNKGAFANTRYASLASVWDACREPLTKNGLSVVQSTRMEGNAVVIVTTLLHASGEHISGEIALPPTKPDPQGHGSAITYARRYALSAMVGIAPEDDDDGAAGSEGGGKPQPANKPTAAPPPPAAKKQSPAEWTAAYIAGLAPVDSMDALRDYTAERSAALVRLDKVDPDLRDRIEMAIAEKRHSLELAENNPFKDQ